MPLISISPLGQLSVAQQLQVSQASRNRTITLADNKRYSLRGVSHLSNREFYAYQEDEDNLTYLIDLSSYIDGANITAVNVKPNGNTISGAFHTTTKIAQRIKGFGRLDVRVTLDSGDTENIFLNILPKVNGQGHISAYS